MPPTLICAPPRCRYGPLRADLESTYTFLETLFAEVAEAFPDAVFNIGGDEVSSNCYEENAEVAAYLKLHNMSGALLIKWLDSFSAFLFTILRQLTMACSCC
jgi:hypothetical protein